MDEKNPDSGSGSGQHLPRAVLALATLSAVFATVLSFHTIILQLKNYRKLSLQRFTVRILVMVPVFAVASLISLYSLDLALFLDPIRDIYEAFVIYCFFTLLVEYLGGERSLIILLSGRPAVPHPRPFSIIYRPMDVSDPFTFLALKRGILQYVQLKPILTLITLIMKSTGTYQDGTLEQGSGYAYVAFVQNASVSLALYCLVMFWKATHEDLKPFRPVPKFLCVKGIIFFSFWQGLGVAILVAMGIIHSSTFPIEMLSLAIQDTLICFEMPFFAFLHMYAFSYLDYIDPQHIYSGRLPFFYAVRDAFGLKDVLADSLTTAKGTGFSYRTFEPAGDEVGRGIHQGQGRERRVKAGLRYAKGGKTKYWLPEVGEEQSLLDNGHRSRGKRERQILSRREGEIEEAWNRRVLEEGGREYDEDESEPESLGFGEGKDEDIEALYTDSRRLEYGDFNYPILDASREDARRRMRDEEDGLIYRPTKSKAKATKKTKGKGRQLDPPALPAQRSSYSRLADPSTTEDAASSSTPVTEDTFALGGSESEDEEEEDEASKRKRVLDDALERARKIQLPSDAVDLVIVDKRTQVVMDQRKVAAGGKKKPVYRQTYIPAPSTPVASPSAANNHSPVNTSVNFSHVDNRSAEVVEVGEEQEVPVEEATKKSQTVPSRHIESQADNPWS